MDIYQREFLALRDRLHTAEQENLKRSKELNLVLDEIKRAIAEKQALRDINHTWSSLSGILLYWGVLLLCGNSSKQLTGDCLSLTMGNVVQILCAFSS